MQRVVQGTSLPQPAPAPTPYVLRIAALTALVALAGPAAASARGPDPDHVYLAAGAFDPLRDPLPVGGLPPRSHYAPGEIGGFVLQFERPITGADRRALEDLGATLGGSVPLRALEAVMTEAQRSRIAALPGVRWVSPFQPGWKIASRERDRLLASPSPRPRTLRLRVALFAGADAAGVAQLRGVGGHILHRTHARAFSLADVEIPAARLDELLQLPLVRFVQAIPVRVFHNDRARLHM